MGLSLSLRPAEPGDLDACAEVYVAAAAVAFPWVPPAARGPAAFRGSIQDEEIWVAEAPDAIAGFVSIYLPQRFIHSLYVRPDRHRQGIGRALLDRALGRCGGHAALKCQEANRAACQFYLRLGWRPMDWGWSEAGPWIMFAY
jgi:GNAT superfamily N-acetyltransferase